MDKTENPCASGSAIPREIAAAMPAPSWSGKEVKPPSLPGNGKSTTLGIFLYNLQLNDACVTFTPVGRWVSSAKAYENNRF
jgi:hypothetical protein